MQTYVFDFCNIYIPQNYPYRNEEYNIRIEPLKGAETFKKNRKDHSSPYSVGYWKTAKCYIKAERDRAEELATWLSFIYSFAQNRDIRWTTYYPYQKGYQGKNWKSKGEFPLENDGHELIHIVTGSGRGGVGEFVDRALTALDDASQNERSRITRSLALFFESEGQEFWMLRFLFLWIVLESNANHNYDKYTNNRQPLFNENEQERLRDSVLEMLRENWKSDKVINKSSDEVERWDSDESRETAQINHIEWVLDRTDIYESSSVVKIKMYMDYLDIGFDSEEIRDIVETARNIRNPIVHKINSDRLMNQHKIVPSLRTIVFYVLLRLLGVDRELQDRLLTVNFLGPDISEE
ncbi:hypothetical protein [Halorubrum sp. LN27]|uniref:hypothetical protein n=1 Tax=Halorubrum sp. LN27 TaxID=2801032 RepID=UPI00190CEB8C|nr:hypothetical protein [Halorubrum sp. LN27]